ncbi:MAG: SEL1-like repeat protein [Alphaproteobacteria bacterium]|nr:SEL1-like repeat protein [Alphaproteobacteria bacterium]
MAELYLSGDGITQDSEKGTAWLKKAAAQGYRPAETLLAITSQRFEFHTR